jgi:hypothetical protein
MEANVVPKRCPRLCFVLMAMMFVAACGGGDDGSEAAPGDPTAENVGDAASGEQDVTDSDGVSESADAETDAPEPEAAASEGGGVILADLCSGGQPLDGAISLGDLVTYGLLSSADARVEGSGAYDAFAYETFGFLCNITEVGGEGENFVTIGMTSGSDTWDLAVDFDTAQPERMGEWDVIVGSNWLSPLAMRFTDAAGNQDSLFVTWVPADGSIPDAPTLERVMRPLAEAIAARASVEIPRS